MRLHLFDHGHRPHLLIVCGNTAFAAALARSVSPERFEISVATSRVEALNFQATGKFAGYVIDATLPDAHGAELVRNLRDGRVTAPILFLESLAETLPARTDADATLTKPISLAEFRGMLRELFPSVEPASALSAAPRRKAPSFHLSAILIPILLGAGIALTYWLLSLT